MDHRGGDSGAELKSVNLLLFFCYISVVSRLLQVDHSNRKEIQRLLCLQRQSSYGRKICLSLGLDTYEERTPRLVDAC